MSAWPEVCSGCPEPATEYVSGLLDEAFCKECAAIMRYGGTTMEQEPKCCENCDQIAAMIDYADAHKNSPEAEAARSV